jgi:cytochrome P450
MWFDPSSPDFRKDPYPTYIRLRDEAPFLWDEASGLWFVSRHADIAYLLRDRRLGRTMEHILPSAPAPAHFAAFQRLSTYSLFDKEPPDHTRLRGLVSAVFTPKKVEALRPQIEETSASLLKTALNKGEFDLLEDYAVPLPVLVIADLLGVPQADRPRLRPWSAAIVAMYELDHDAEQEHKAVQAAGEFWDYLDWLASQRREKPQDDLISALAAVTDQESGARLSTAELIATCILLLNAGHEATVNGFGNGLYALFRHPDQLARLQADHQPERVRLCVEEMLRYDSPLQLFKRWVLQDFEYGGTQFTQGHQIALFFGSANRDPRRFVRAEELDISRQENPHLSFGAGIHFCLGAPLARLELNVALATLLRNARNLQLASEPEWRDSVVIRGLKALNVLKK